MCDNYRIDVRGLETFLSREEWSEFENKPKAKRVFLICSVRGASLETLAAQEEYVRSLEAQGHTVHYPPRDTKQDAPGFLICGQNAEAIVRADEVHIFYNPESQGTHFDMGVAFAFHKPIKVVKNIEYGPGKSYARMLNEWAEYWRVARQR